MNPAKYLIARLPRTWVLLLRRWRARRLIAQGRFDAGEPEFDHLSEWLKPGDWALDIGANLGTYSVHMSRIVGDSGRVIVFEPVPETFSILVSNLVFAGCGNVTPINAAVSDSVGVAEMRIPVSASGMENHYQARLSHGRNKPGDRLVRALTVTVDQLDLGCRVALVKIDAEGHEPFVLAGMRNLVARDLPVLILETTSEPDEAWLLDLGYQKRHFPGSPNNVFACSTD